MKIVKSTERPAERALVSLAESVKEVPSKVGSFFTDARKKNLMIICAAFLVGAAVILNIALFSGKEATAQKPDGDKAPTTDSTDKDAGADTPESYFALATLDRQQAREEALEVLQLIVDSSDAKEDEKVQAR